MAMVFLQAGAVFSFYLLYVLRGNWRDIWSVTFWTTWASHWLFIVVEFDHRLQRQKCSSAIKTSHRRIYWTRFHLIFSSESRVTFRVLVACSDLE
jgi:hypothetical protein